MKKNYILTPEQKADAQRLKALFDKRVPKMSQLTFANAFDLGSQGNVGHYLNGRSPLNLTAAIKFANGLNVSIADFSPIIAKKVTEAAITISGSALPSSQSNASRAPYQVEVANGDDDSIAIPYYDVKGSCGGGSENGTPELKGHLRKEPAWFTKYKIKPQNAMCIYAHGESMEPYLLDGDMVILDNSQTEPQSGGVYLINHPDGERLKRLRREFDGTWVLESDNLNKKMYPDERISPEHADLMKIIGRVIYRQG